MWTALWWKEWRECSLFAGLALLAMIQIVGGGMNLPLLPFPGSRRGAEIPFLTYYEFDRQVYFTGIAIVAAIVIGLQQTLWESWRQTTLFLLHRPLPRDWIFLGKLAAGASLLVLVTGVPLLIYSLWAAAPGTHASPFAWSMTEPWWRSIIVALVCYVGAFLAGLRPANWIGSKTWPAITAMVLALLLKLPSVLVPLVYVALFGLMALLILSILETARSREFP